VLARTQTGDFAAVMARHDPDFARGDDEKLVARITFPEENLAAPQVHRGESPAE
jgi:hypothetical protein